MNHLTASWAVLATATAYVLVHPESFPSNDWPVDDQEYGKQVQSAGARAASRIVILDDYGMEDLDDEALTFTYGSFDGWHIVRANPNELGPEIVAKIGVQAGTAVRVGGFHRDDCVRRVVEQLTQAGFTATLDDETTLPR